jgi:integrase
MAIKVTLRKKPISGNRESLYLDFYPPIPNPKTGEPTRREFLGIYVPNPIKHKKRKDKKGSEKLIPVYDNNPIQNQLIEIFIKDELQRAETIRQTRENELKKPEIYAVFEKEQLRIKEQGEQSFVAYFKSLADKRKSSNHDNWVSAYNYLVEFTKGNLRFVDLNEKFFNDFKDYLLTTKSNKSNKVTLAQNSAVSYFNKLKATLKQAYKDGYLLRDLNRDVKPIKQAETRRNFLTIEELNSLVRTECNNPLLKRAALFSALTGLRFSDIKNLVWGEIEFVENDGYVIRFTQQKTKGVEDLQISEQAYNLLGERKEPADKVFEGLTYSAHENKNLAKWIGLAGIAKDITFHCFRHTFATLQLSKGTDIYTVSKMLGHRDLKTTQIYAKIIDQTKREAADKIQLDFNPLSIKGNG